MEPNTLNTTLQTCLQQLVAREGVDVVLLSMGYSERSLERARDRLQVVLADPDLGLGTGGYDFRFSSREFLRALASALAVDTIETDRRIEDIEAGLERLRQLFKPWIFVDTQFKRSGEPIFLLAWMESTRRLRLPVKARLLSRDELTKVAAGRIREHYRKTEGQLPIWGDIIEYKLVVSDAEQIVMGKDGKVLRAEPRCLGGFAVMTLGN